MGNFYRHLMTFYWSRCEWPQSNGLSMTTTINCKNNFSASVSFRLFFQKKHHNFQDFITRLQFWPTQHEFPNILYFVSAIILVCVVKPRDSVFSTKINIPTESKIQRMTGPYLGIKKLRVMLPDQLLLGE